jgi:hypothetical protein|tara:strand:+ start:3059 stop:3226 length:168 start_codon:yes stop_codon:yes gene_type:complete
MSEEIRKALDSVDTLAIWDICGEEALELISEEVLRELAYEICIRDGYTVEEITNE